MARPTPFVPLAAADAARLVEHVPAVDAARLEERAASLWGGTPGLANEGTGLDLIVRSLDLTALAGTETVDEVERLCARAVRPDPADRSVPSVAAVCLWPGFVPIAVSRLAGSGVRVASVAGDFPTARAPLADRLREIERVVADGAVEVDVVMQRTAFLEGRYADAYDELLAIRRAAGPATLKTIVEVGALGSLDLVRRASVLAIVAGADFIKTSSGKIGTGVTLASALTMMEAIGDLHRDTGRAVGVKVAGGIRTADQAIGYLGLTHETLGSDWLTPARFRIGASSLLDDLLPRIRVGDA
jgi:deoxyribose-phosphate aldolase